MAIYKDGEKVDEVTKDDATVPNIENMIKNIFNMLIKY